jgi:hypothetical protein
MSEAVSAGAGVIGKAVLTRFLVTFRSTMPVRVSSTTDRCAQPKLIYDNVLKRNGVARPHKINVCDTRFY